MLNLNSKGSL